MLIIQHKVTMCLLVTEGERFRLLRLTIATYGITFVQALSAKSTAVGMTGRRDSDIDMSLPVLQIT